MELQFVAMSEDHWDAISRIYALGISTGLATFEVQLPEKEKFFASKIPALSFSAMTPDGTVVGWVAAAPVSARPAYRGVVEHSVYVDPRFAGNGIASGLLAELISRAREQEFWMVQSAIIGANEASRKLHAKLGFREVGRRERIAQAGLGPLAGQWLDTYLYELRL